MMLILISFLDPHAYSQEGCTIHDSCTASLYLTTGSNQSQWSKI